MESATDSTRSFFKKDPNDLSLLVPATPQSDHPSFFAQNPTPNPSPMDGPSQQ